MLKYAGLGHSQIGVGLIYIDAIIIGLPRV